MFEKVEKVSNEQNDEIKAASFFRKNAPKLSSELYFVEKP